MKILLCVVLIIVGVYTEAWSQRVKVEIRGIRTARGNVMVMAQESQQSKPVYALVAATKDTASVVLENVTWETFQISLFHDENGNWEMDKDEQGRPVEGYARDKCKSKPDVPTIVRMKLFYPVKN